MVRYRNYALKLLILSELKNCISIFVDFFFISSFSVTVRQNVAYFAVFIIYWSI